MTWTHPTAAPPRDIKGRKSERFADTHLNMDRYLVHKGSQSSHCCFDATVVDTTKPDIVNGVHYKNETTGQFHYDAVCECFNEEDAQLICKALNALNQQYPVDCFYAPSEEIARRYAQAITEKVQESKS